MSALVVAEPPAAYAERPRLVVDASVLAAGLFGETGRDEARSWIRGRRLCAPHLVDYEIANVVLSKLRRDELDEPAATDALDLYRTMDLERHSVEPRAVLALAVRTRLTAYDAAYLWLAQGLNAPLATFDGRLGAIAVEHLRKGG